MPKPFDLLTEFGKFSASNGVSLKAPDTLPEFLKHVEKELTGAKEDPALLHGQRTENMFEAMVVSLNRFKLFKVEDAAGIYPLEAFKVCDFRIVTLDDQHWCVEVKNFYQKDPINENYKLSTGYLDKLTSYANLTGARLKIAIYWARWSVWTLVAPEEFLTPNGGVSISFVQAIAGNELSVLGDLKIGMKAPLCLRLIADSEMTNKLEGDARAEFSIGGVKIFCDGTELIEPIDQQIALLFIYYGDWEGEGTDHKVNANDVAWVDVDFTPRDSKNEGFDFIGSLSTVFAKYYAQETLDDKGIHQLKAPTQPEWFKAIMDPNHKSNALPLWKFKMEPNYALSYREDLLKR